MTWLPRTAGLVAMISSAGAVHADEPSAPPARPTPSGTTLGLGLTADTQADGRWGLAPEAHGHVHRAIGAGFSLRVGGRLACGGLTQAVVDQISDHKNEPAWMREFRHKALDIFLA